MNAKNHLILHSKHITMQQHTIQIRQAIKSDASFIAHAVAMAIGDEKAMRNYCGEDYIALLTEIAENEKSQYSYTNSFVAEFDGKIVGAIVGYDGANLHELRATTYSIIYKCLGHTPTIPDETEAGEFYLDSIAVFPEYRRLGIGKELIKAIKEKAFSQGHVRVGLIVDSENPRAEALYTSLGFTRVGEKTFFGHKMWHLQTL